FGWLTDTSRKAAAGHLPPRPLGGMFTPLSPLAKARQERAPLNRRDRQHRPLGVLAVTHRNHACHVSGYLHAVAVPGAGSRRLAPLQVHCPITSCISSID